jgi:DNA-binding response OmpR family regulator
MPEPKHIVVVDDCALIRDAVSVYLTMEGYRVTVVEDGAGLRHLLQSHTPDLVILDLNMPGEDGFSLTRFLRERCACGIIMLTSKADTTNRVVGLEIGADDFIVKPYESRELLARVRSVLRRLEGPAAPARVAAETATPLDFGLWQFDLDGRRVLGGGQSAELTTAEFNLLQELSKKPGRVLTREHLMNVVYERPWNYYDRSIDVLVTRLRRKLEQVSRGHSVVKSVRGSGYLFSVSAATATG